MKHFNELDLPEKLRIALEQMEFETPTPIQAQAIPPALEGRDILGSAQTGTGKTGAFGIPLVARMHNHSRGKALILTPTRELAVQVRDEIKRLLGGRSMIKTALLIGGESIVKQVQSMQIRPRVIVGTPGRINDHLERGSLMLADANFLVLDETDRMLDMGFTIQIEQIMKYLPKQRQTLLFSATLPDNIVNISKKYLFNPVRVSVGAESTPAKNIRQEVIHLAEAEKYQELRKQLDTRDGSIIVFVKTKHGADKMADKLYKQGYKADTIHGDLRQSKRDKVLESFRDEEFRILVATDVAARGLDIPHIEHVINYDLPQAPEDYIHRIGRTARAGAEGDALCLISPKDKPLWHAIERMLDPDMEQTQPVPQDNRNQKKPSNNRNRRRGGRGNGGNNKPQGKKTDGNTSGSGKRNRRRNNKKSTPKE